MIEKIISDRKEDYSFYVKCDCGKEILHFFYYKESADCPEVIAINCFSVNNNLSDIPQVRLSSKTLRQLSNELKLAYGTQTHEAFIESFDSIIHIQKDQNNFFTISKIKNKLNLSTIWDISLREYNVELLIEKLDKLYDFILITREKIKEEYVRQLNEKNEKPFSMSDKIKNVTYYFNK